MSRKLGFLLSGVKPLQLGAARPPVHMIRGKETRGEG